MIRKHLVRVVLCTMLSCSLIAMPAVQAKESVLADDSIVETTMEDVQVQENLGDVMDETGLIESSKTESGLEEVNEEKYEDLVGAGNTEVEDNGSRDKSNLLSVNTVYTGNSGTENDLDCFKFILPSDGYVSLTIGAKDSSIQKDLSGYWGIALYDAGGNTFYKDVNLAGTEETPSWGLSKGLYYIELWGAYYNKPDEYIIKINFTATDAWEKEYNDSFETANAVTVNKWYTGNAYTYGDEDFFKFEIPQKGYISVTAGAVDSSIQPNINDFWSLEIYDVGKNIWYRDDYLAGIETTSNFGMAPGLYYLKVKSTYYYKTDHYKFNINFTPSDYWEAEYNNVWDSANSIELNKSYSGNSYTHGDDDYFKFTLDKEGIVSINAGAKASSVQTNLDGFWGLTLYDAGTNVIYEDDKLAGKEDSKAFVLAAGTYYLRIRGAYYLKFDEYEFKINYSEPNMPFADVVAGAYYYEPVKYAYLNNITTGTSATTFEPDKSCTRGQVVTFLWRAMGSPEPRTTTCPFKDVASGEYYYKAVLWAAENRITTGTTPTTFSPKAKVTRGQFVTFLYRLKNSPSSSISNPFRDVANGKYYYDAVMWAVKNGITTGTSKTTFEPDKYCTRGQVVTFIYRAVK